MYIISYPKALLGYPIVDIRISPVKRGDYSGIVRIYYAFFYHRIKAVDRFMVSPNTGRTFR